MTVQEIIGRAKSEGRGLLTEVEAKELLKQADISVVETRLATSRDEALSISQELGFPVALKIASSDVVHKTDAGGVKLNLETSEQVGQAYDDIIAAVKAMNEGLIPAAKNCDNKIDGCNLNISSEPQKKDINYALCCSYTFGGQTAAVVLKKQN